jgi:hypothetical protein
MGGAALGQQARACRQLNRPGQRCRPLRQLPLPSHDMRRSSLGRVDHRLCSTMCSPPRASAGRTPGSSRQQQMMSDRCCSDSTLQNSRLGRQAAGASPSTGESSSSREQAGKRQAGRQLQGRPPTVQGCGLAAAQLVGLPQRGDLPAAQAGKKQYKRRAARQCRVRGRGRRAGSGS